MSEGTDGLSPLSIITSTYGPFAFGVVSLMLIWFGIVKPELNARAVDYAAVNEIVEGLNQQGRSQAEIARAMDATASTMAVTAAVLERTVQRLEAMTK